MYKKPGIRTITIASTETDSDVIEIGDYVVQGVICLAEFDGTTITFTASSARDGTFYPVYGSDGAQVSLAAAASRAIGLSSAEADAMAPWSFIKLICGTAQTGATTLILVLK